MPHRTRTASALERAAARYLDLLGSALLDEHYLDHEVRLEYLVACIENRRSPSPAKLRDPRREMKTKVDRLDAARRSGARSSLPYTDMGRVRLMHLQRCLDTVRSEPITGDLLECGTGRGGSAIFMRGYLEAHELPDRLVWVADQFRVSEEPSGPLLDLSPDLNIVRDGFAAFGFCDERVRFLQGAYAETLAAAPIGPLALLHIGAGLGPPVGDVLEATYERLATGAPVIVDDARPDVAPSRRPVPGRPRHHRAAPTRRRHRRHVAAYETPSPRRPFDRGPASYRRADKSLRPHRDRQLLQPTPRSGENAPLFVPGLSARY